MSWPRVARGGEYLTGFIAGAVQSVIAAGAVQAAAAWAACAGLVWQISPSSSGAIEVPVGEPRDGVPDRCRHRRASGVPRVVDHH